MLHFMPLDYCCFAWGSRFTHSPDVAISKFISDWVPNEKTYRLQMCWPPINWHRRHKPGTLEDIHVTYYLIMKTDTSSLTLTGVLQMLQYALNRICRGSHWSFPRSGAGLLNESSSLLTCTRGSLPYYLGTIWTTNTMQQSPPEANRSSANQEILRILWNPKFPSLVRSQSQMNPFNTLPF
jgi:hypothetical protein